MAEKDYKYSYKYCLHYGERVTASESVVINKKHYHWDCALMKKELKECTDLYMEYIEDKTQYPIVCRILNTLAFKNNIPVEYIKEKIEMSGKYYRTRPVYALYGIRKLYYEIDTGWAKKSANRQNRD